MTNAEYAKSKGITVEELRRESMTFLNCEGYDDNGNEYETLDAWLDRKPSYGPQDPFDEFDTGRD